MDTFVIFMFHVSFYSTDLSHVSFYSTDLSVPCGLLLRKSLPLGFLVCDVSLCFCHFTIWCLKSGVVLD